AHHTSYRYGCRKLQQKPPCGNACAHHHWKGSDIWRTVLHFPSEDCSNTYQTWWWKRAASTPCSAPALLQAYAFARCDHYAKISETSLYTSHSPISPAHWRRDQRTHKVPA